mgnify:CR=1 FL=1
MVTRIRNEELGIRNSARPALSDFGFANFEFRISAHPPGLARRNVGASFRVRQRVVPKINAVEETQRGWWRALKDPPTTGSARTEVTTLRFKPKPRSGDRYLAWGVSPRNRIRKIKQAPKGRQMRVPLLTTTSPRGPRARLSISRRGSGGSARGRISGSAIRFSKCSGVGAWVRCGRLST